MVSAIRNHWDGVIRYFTSRLTNAVLEGINSLDASASFPAYRWLGMRRISLNAEDLHLEEEIIRQFCMK